MTEPTDAELGKLAEECGIGWAAGLGGMSDFLSAFARAVLAKWGTPQPVVREPLTDEQIERDRPMMVEPAAYAAGVRYVEKHHGIKGGQHGTE